MTRDDARAYWAASGLTYADLTGHSLKGLRKIIDAALRSSGLIEGYRAAGAPRITRIGTGIAAEIYCRAYYFDRREAVTFNRDGFIGFAGWADEKNVQPILSAFRAWVDELKSAAPRVAR
ncbi:hypothetical protein [Defluviimonas salinarum]|uniref:Uncharacterized protein n=1 Tax=Defluviimonas salinarum TaxID=2992147 RepID=A0ABT3J7D0_9RHOB|nr:hypothetical protein [Defluviimonas salinarum]MCW3783566.1 hypothetical protein [Defluviimonas salinarum]